MLKRCSLPQECLCLTCEQRGRGFFSAPTSASVSPAASDLAAEFNRRSKSTRATTQASRGPIPLDSFGSSSSSSSPQPPDADRQHRHLVLYEDAWPKRPRAFHPSTPDHDRPFDALASALYRAICALPLDAIPTGRAEPDFVSNSDNTDDEKALLVALPAVERAAISKMREKDRKRHLARLRQERQARANGVAALFSEDEDEDEGDGAGSQGRRKRPRLAPDDDWELEEVVLRVRHLDCIRIDGASADPQLRDAGRRVVLSAHGSRLWHHHRSH